MSTTPANEAKQKIKSRLVDDKWWVLLETYDNHNLTDLAARFYYGEAEDDYEIIVLHHSSERTVQVGMFRRVRCSADDLCAYLTEKTYTGASVSSVREAIEQSVARGLMITLVDPYDSMEFNTGLLAEISLWLEMDYA